MSELSKVAISGPLERYAEGFADGLARQGYAPSVVVIHVRRLAHVSRWLDARGLDASALDEAAGEAFLADRRAAGRDALLRIGSLASLLEYLRGIGAAPAPGPVPRATPADALLARYAGYLAAERGLSVKTIARNVTALRPFLAVLACEGRPDLGLGRLTAREIMDFVVGQSRQRPGTMPHLVTALRSLLRFLHVDGVTATGLADAVPAAAGRKLAGLPKALPAEQVAAMLASCDQGTALGRRDLAVLTVLSRLGLRASEVAGLRLEDIDWHRGEITVTGKGGRTERLPLPADVGTAIVAYLARRPAPQRRPGSVPLRQGPAPRDEPRSGDQRGGQGRPQGRARHRPRAPPAPQRRDGHAGRRRVARRDRPGAPAQPRAHHRHLRESRRHGAARRRAALAGTGGGCVSPLREALSGYLSVRRALGFRLDRAEKLIGQFIDYLEERQAGVVTIEHAVAWATAPAGAASWWHALRLSAVRPFASWLHSLDNAHEVPPPGLIPPGPHRAVPYLYSSDEIGALVTAADAGRPARPPTRP